MPDPNGVLELWRHEGARTDRAFGFFVDADVTWCPTPSDPPLAQLLMHIVHSRSVTVYWLLAPSATAANTHPEEPKGRADLALLRRRLASAGRSLFRVLAQLPPARFQDVIAPFGAPEPRGVMALGMLKHELHHRGELHAYARVLGKPIVPLYAPLKGPIRSASGSERVT
jgi:uncharacterized damage-inducible protein DinB